MGYERTGGRTGQQGGKDRCFNFREALAAHESADAADDGRSQECDAAGILIHDQVNISSSVAFFLVGETMELLRKGTQRFCQMCIFMDFNRQFTGLCLDDITLDTDDVADIALLEELVDFFADNLFLDDDLDLSVSVKQVHETDLAHAALGHDTAGNGDFRLQGFQFLGTLFRIGTADIGRMRRAAVSLAERIEACFLQGIHLLAAGQFLVVQFILLLVLCFLFQVFLVFLRQIFSNCRRQFFGVAADSVEKGIQLFQIIFRHVFRDDVGMVFNHFLQLIKSAHFHPPHIYKSSPP